MRIDVPDPIIDIVCDPLILDARQWIREYTVSIVVGGVTVMRRTYHDDHDRYGSGDYADSEEIAKEMCAGVFGEKLRKLIGEV